MVYRFTFYDCLVPLPGCTLICCVSKSVIIAASFSALQLVIWWQVVREALAGLRPLLCSEDMEAQERAHNASALLSAVLRRLNPDDAALAAPDSPEAIAATDLVNTLLDHEHRLVY